MDWAKIEVEGINGTIVTLNTTVHYNNGTLISQSSSVDVKGSQYMSTRFLIASSLNSGDPLTNEPNSPTINQTTSRIYAGASRNVNLLEITAVSANQTVVANTCWDQSTGIMVEMYIKWPDYLNPGEYVENSIKATETNMWSADLIGTLYNNLNYIIAATIIIILVVAVAIILRRKKPRPSPPAQTPQTSTTDTKQE